MPNERKMQIQIKKEDDSMRRCAIFILVIFSLFMSGCLESIISEVRYESTPISLEYKISYGYYINSSGKGDFNVNYTCFVPQPINGYISNLSVIGNYSYNDLKIGSNRIITWSFDENGRKNIKIGIEVSVKTNAFLVDLDSTKYLDIKNISMDIKRKYCRDQSIENKTLIQPSDLEIKNLAYSLKISDNAFEVAKSIFEWLKENTNYVYHPQQSLPQSAKETLNLKSGDCDDLSILYISLCRAVGIPSRLVRGYLIEEKNGKYIATPHAWAEIYVGFGKDGWIPVECAGISKDIEAEVHQNFGIEDAFHLRLFVDNGTNESLALSSRGVRVRYEEGLKIEMKPFVEVSDVSIGNYGSLVVRKDGRRFYS